MSRVINHPPQLLVRELWTGDIHLETARTAGPKARAFKPDKDGTISFFGLAPGTTIQNTVNYLRSRKSRRRGTRIGYCVLDSESVLELLPPIKGVLRSIPVPNQDVHGVGHWGIDVADVPPGPVAGLRS